MMTEPDCAPPDGLPAPRSLAELNRRLAATPSPPGYSARTVPGEGPMAPRLALVGEQPGDREDVAGRPFVGPAGSLLDQALTDAGVPRRETYVTNAVKRFKYEPRGKRRLHRSPTVGEVQHARWWLERELAFVRPGLVVALGATAALALAGRRVAVTRERGPLRFGPWPGYVTLHPSALLRIRPHADRDAAYRAFVADLERARDLAA